LPIHGKVENDYTTIKKKEEERKEESHAHLSYFGTKLVYWTV